MSVKTLNIDIQQLPDRVIAYLSHTGSYQNNPELFGNLFSQLMKWAAPKGLLAQPGMEMITLYYDHPDTTPKEEQRIRVGLSVPNDTTPDNGIQLMEIPSGTFLVGSYELDTEDYKTAWESIYEYAEEKAYAIKDEPMYESYKNNPEQHPEGKHLVDICIPVDMTK